MIITTHKQYTEAISERDWLSVCQAYGDCSKETIERINELILSINEYQNRVL